jgi:hypothetical protein
MAKSQYTAVAGNEHNISVYDAISGNYVSSIFITSGKIIGQPIVSAKTITVTYNEGGSNYMAVYDAETLSFIRNQSLS